MFCWDDAGVKGVAVDDQPEGQKKLVVGKRMAVEKPKDSHFDSRDEQNEAFLKLEAGMAVDSVDQICLELDIADQISFLSDLARKLCDLLVGSGGKSTRFYSFLAVTDEDEVPQDFCLKYLKNKSRM
ncbi:unnamed protein product [Durusdinium trenchii]|uniref:Uncharacterized protein n=1 Tax=Durusdinium trenchii TaxID=1381693 RepID=A0ABP0JL86_9DINO